MKQDAYAVGLLLALERLYDAVHDTHLELAPIAPSGHKVFR